MAGIRTRVRGDTGDYGNPRGESAQVSTETGSNPTQSQIGEITCYQLNQVFSRVNSIDCDPIHCLSKLTTMTKVKSSLVGRAGTVGLGMSGMTNLNLSGSFTKGVSTKGSEISILCFEVAKTIVKGYKLMRSLSKDGIDHLKTVVLSSEGVKILVSEDMDECLRIVAADKREELEMFVRLVACFGNRCRDPQWHHLGPYFAKLFSVLTRRNGWNAESMMQPLMTLVRYTAELFNEMCALDQLEQNYQKKLQADVSNVAQRGDIAILRVELKNRRKLVKSLKKKSLWSKNLEEVVEKLVDIGHFVHLGIHEAFGSADGYQRMKVSRSNEKKLGPAGIAFNYATIIKQIDSLVFHPSFVPANMRDVLYQSLPRNISSELSRKIRSLQVEIEEVRQAEDDMQPSLFGVKEVRQAEDEMMKTLLWLVPIARNTIKAVEGFGWVGGWADLGFEMNQRPAAQTDTPRIETLYHADKEKTEACILQLVIWLHQYHLFRSYPFPIEYYKISESRRDLVATRWPSSTTCMDFDIDGIKAFETQAEPGSS